MTEAILSMIETRYCITNNETMRHMKWSIIKGKAKHIFEEDTCSFTDAFRDFP